MSVTRCHSPSLQPQIAKIESEGGLRNLDEIIDAADGVILARGKLGMVVTPEKVALAQSVVVTKANVAGTSMPGCRMCGRFLGAERRSALGAGRTGRAPVVAAQHDACLPA